MIFNLLELGLNFKRGSFWLSVAEVTLPQDEFDPNEFLDNDNWCLFSISVDYCRVTRLDLFYLRLI